MVFIRTKTNPLLIIELRIGISDRNTDSITFIAVIANLRVSIIGVFNLAPIFDVKSVPREFNSPVKAGIRAKFKEVFFGS